MYIRIGQNELRFRVSRKEAESLINGQVISQACSFSNDFDLSYEVVASNQANELCFEKNTSRLKLRINLSELKSQLATRPTKTGILFRQYVESGSLQVSLEVDIKKPKTVSSD